MVNSIEYCETLEKCIKTLESRVTKLEGRFNKGYVKNQEERIDKLEREMDRVWEIIQFHGDKFE